MKYFRIFTFLATFFCVITAIACKSNIGQKQNSSLPNLPKIIQPTFESYSHGSEKAYHVSFSFQEGAYKPEEVVLFGVRKPLKASNFTGNQVNVDVIHQTQKLQGYKIILTELANGVIFKIDNITYLKTVNFKNSKK